jgi:integrase
LTRRNVVPWIRPDQAKARKAIAVPLNAEAVLLIRKQIGKHPTQVFNFRGKPITQVSTKARYRALERGRHRRFPLARSAPHLGELACAKKGTSLLASQESGGRESPEMVRRYAHLAADHLAPYAERLCALRVVESGGDVTNLAQTK